jgi:hypothetical protein
MREAHSTYICNAATKQHYPFEVDMLFSALCVIIALCDSTLHHVLPLISNYLFLPTPPYHSSLFIPPSLFLSLSLLLLSPPLSLPVGGLWAPSATRCSQASPLSQPRHRRNWTARSSRRRSRVPHTSLHPHTAYSRACWRRICECCVCVCVVGYHPCVLCVCVACLS